MWTFGGITRQSDLIICGQHKDGRHHEEVGAVIDKNGMDIEAVIREMSKTKVEVSERKYDGKRRVIRLEGEQRTLLWQRT